MVPFSGHWCILIASFLQATCEPCWAEPDPAPLNFVERFVRVSLDALVYICVGTNLPFTQA